MKTHHHHNPRGFTLRALKVLTPCLFTSVMLGLGLMVSAGQAQTFTVLKSFGILTNVTGFNPRAQLVQGPDGTLYGTTSGGGSSGCGTVFKLNTDGTGYTVLRHLTGSDGNPPSPDGSFRWTDDSPPSPSGFYRLRRE